MNEKTARRVFLVSCAVLALGAAFLFGYAARQYGFWPDRWVRDSQKVARSLLRHGRVVPMNLHARVPAGAPRERVTHHDPAQVQPGWYAIMLWDAGAGRYAVWLLDHHGERHHEWPVDYSRIDPDGPHNGSDGPHGLLVLADGSIVVNFDHADAMARFDGCGDPVWVQRAIFHHSLDQQDDGTIWTWRSPGTPYAYHHELVRLDPRSGEVLESISLLEDVLASGEEAETVLGPTADMPFPVLERTPRDRERVDIFHPNDIEVLDADLAASFPQFEAGDLLISLRNNHLVAVVDRQDHVLKWWQHGPWLFQHDPDFLASGLISVYDNNSQRGKSKILTVDPRTGEVDDPLHGGEVRFYSKAMGKHQHLPNGNVLIVVPGEGRVLQVTASGRRVFEFNNVVEDLEGVNAHVAHALWLPREHFADLPFCGENH
jgi:hypothetical protein